MDNFWLFAELNILKKKDLACANGALSFSDGPVVLFYLIFHLFL